METQPTQKETVFVNYKDTEGYLKITKMLIGSETHQPYVDIEDAEDNPYLVYQKGGIITQRCKVKPGYKELTMEEFVAYLVPTERGVGFCSPPCDY
jgi:hypothetical protein